MFRPFLGISKQPRGEGLILLGVLPSGPCAGQRPHGHLAVDHTDHDLW